MSVKFATIYDLAGEATFVNVHQIVSITEDNDRTVIISLSDGRFLQTSTPMRELMDIING